jgi:hypothetical protein
VGLWLYVGSGVVTKVYVPNYGINVAVMQAGQGGDVFVGGKVVVTMMVMMVVMMMMMVMIMMVMMMMVMMMIVVIMMIMMVLVLVWTVYRYHTTRARRQ